MEVVWGEGGKDGAEGSSRGQKESRQVHIIAKKIKLNKKNKKSIINLLLQPQGAAEEDGPRSDTICFLFVFHWPH